MGVRRGSISVRRYVVLDPLPTRPHERFLKGLRAHAFLPIDPQSEIDRSAGWVSLLDGDDADLSKEKVYFVGAAGPSGASSEQLRVALRLDVLKPPPAEVKRQTAARVQAIEAEEGRTLSRRERRTLQEEVARTVRLRAFPRVKLVDLVWDFAAARVYFWSQTKAHNELLLDLFPKSFGLRLEPEGAARWAGGFVDRDQLARLEPTPELWMGFDGVRPLATGTTTDSTDGE